MSFFELRTPRDMLEKTRREHARLCSDFTIDNVFSFFVSAYHIRDYVAKTNPVIQKALEAFLLGNDLKDCRDLCDKGKHLHLTHRHDPITDISGGGGFGESAFGESAFSDSEEWHLLAEGRNVDVRQLANRVLQKWEEFFEKNGLCLQRQPTGAPASG